VIKKKGIYAKLKKKKKIVIIILTFLSIIRITYTSETAYNIFMIGKAEQHHHLLAIDINWMLVRNIQQVNK
jgi:hypothetical protein